MNYKTCQFFCVSFFKVLGTDHWESLVNLLSEIKRKNKLQFNLVLPEIYGSCAVHIWFVTCNSRIWQAVFSTEICLLSSETSFGQQ